MKSTLFLLLLIMFITTSLESPPISARLTQKSSETKYIMPTHTVVRIINNLGDGENVTLHCKSKEDDLGSHAVPFNQSYEWKFKVNVIETTLFFCGFTWQHGSGVYDIYVAQRDLDRCPTQCLWKVLKNGVHSFNEKNGNEDLYYMWN